MVSSASRLRNLRELIPRRVYIYAVPRSHPRAELVTSGFVALNHMVHILAQWTLQNPDHHVSNFDPKSPYPRIFPHRRSLTRVEYTRSMTTLKIVSVRLSFPLILCLMDDARRFQV